MQVQVSDEMLANIIASSIQEILSMRKKATAVSVNSDTVLFGSNGLFDSIELVSMVVAVEQALEDNLNVSLSLSDEKAVSQVNSPYKTVGTLVAYARSVMDINQCPPQ